MSILLCVLFGLPLLVLGIWRRRQRAIWSGAVLVSLAAGELLYVVWTLHGGGRVPEIAIHSLLIIPASFWLAIVGSRDLNSRGVDS